MQTSGIGQREREWVSPAAVNVYATYAFTIPSFKLANLIHIPQVTALSISQMLDNYNIKSKIKWVNDVLVDNKKISGILCESPDSIEIQAIKYNVVLVGVGINVNSDQEVLSKISQPSTSMYACTNRKYEVGKVLQEFSGYLTNNIFTLINVGLSPLYQIIQLKIENFNHYAIIFDKEFGEDNYVIAQIEGTGANGEIIIKNDQGIVSNHFTGRILRGKEILKALENESVIARLIKEQFFQEIDSTQIYARNHLELCHDGYWHAIRTNYQTDGIGVKGEWDSAENKSVLATFMLPYNDNYTRTQASHAAAISVTKVLEEYNLEPKIKWRNDVMVSGKKISGILAEILEYGTESRKTCLIGVGININQTKEELQNINQPATSIKMENENIYDVAEVFNKLKKYMLYNFELLKSYGFSMLKEQYEELMLFKNNVVSVQIRGQEDIVTGTVKGIGIDGEIILSTQNDEEVSILLGSIVKAEEF